MTLRKKQPRKFVAKAEWVEVGGRKIYFRSRWEAKYAFYLQRLKEMNAIKEWEHEPKTFWFEKIQRGVRSYKPDFHVTLPDGSKYWVEVKGFMDDRSATKIKRFRKYYPTEELRVVSKEFFR